MESGLQCVMCISTPRSDVHSFRSHLTISHTSRLQSVTIQIFPFLHGAWCITDQPSKPQRELTRRWTATPLPLTFSAVLGFDFISWFCIVLGLRFGVRHLDVRQRNASRDIAFQSVQFSARGPSRRPSLSFRGSSRATHRFGVKSLDAPHHAA
jgi:hypothetical protein